MSFHVSISNRSDGTIEAMYIKLRDDEVARSTEAPEGNLVLDYNAAGEVIGIEVLSPVKLDDFVKYIDEPMRNPIRRFMRSGPKELITT